MRSDVAVYLYNYRKDFTSNWFGNINWAITRIESWLLYGF